MSEPAMAEERKLVAGNAHRVVPELFLAAHLPIRVILSLVKSSAVTPVPCATCPFRGTSCELHVADSAVGSPRFAG